MSDSIDILDNAAGHSATVIPEAPHARRSTWGRLYHGETAIDFYGRRRYGFIVSGVLILITLLSLFTRGLNGCASRWARNRRKPPPRCSRRSPMPPRSM